MGHRTAFTALEEAASQFGKLAALCQPAGEGKHRVYSWIEYRDIAREIAAGLRSLGIGKGDRVAIYLPMIPEAVIAMLACDLIHGDLSAYNLLYWEGQLTLIDFPQVVSPKINRHAYEIFSRDVTRISAYFAKQGIKSDPSRLASEIWTSCGYRLPRPGPEDETLE